MRRYTKDHEWITVAGDVATVGITNFAQAQLGDVVYVELPEPGTHIDAAGQIAVVESVKAASEVYAPVAGTVIEVNADLTENPGGVNDAPEGAGWFVKIRVDDEPDLAQLMDEAAYAAYVTELS